MLIFVATKYKMKLTNSLLNSGFWVDLNDFSSESEFLETCKEIHDDEMFPELIFPDWHGIISSLLDYNGTTVKLKPEFWEQHKPIPHSQREPYPVNHHVWMVNP